MIPEPIISYDEKLKIRNAEICQKYLDWYDQDMFKTERVKDLFNRLSQEYDLTHQAIYNILKKNQNLIQFHKGWEKHKRIVELKRLRADKEKSNKDVVDILEQERKEIEGDSPLIDNSVHQTFVYLDQKAVEEENGKNRIKAELPAE
jgi:hypothetical protein